MADLKYMLIVSVILGGAVSIIQADCPPLARPRHGKIVGVCSNRTGSMCTLQCTNPCELIGSADRQCQPNGEWSGQETFCVDRRVRCLPLLDAPDNGHSVGECKNWGGYTCTFACNSGYTLVGSSRVTCLRHRRQWTHDRPVCERITCGAVQPPVGGSMDGSCNPGVPGGTCSFSCDPDYRMVGMQNIKCQENGKWTFPPPQCQRKTCFSLRPPMGGTMVGACDPGLPGATCAFSCLEGFRLVGKKLITCRANGTWDAFAPTCERTTCPPLTEPVGGSMEGHCDLGVPDGICFFSCNDGFTLVGKKKLVCRMSGKWSGRPPICQRRSCPDLFSPTDGFMSGSCSPGKSGESCSFSCLEGYHLYGQSVIDCLQNGTWSSEPPICERIVQGCPEIVPPPGGRLGACSTVAGGSCYIQCNSGYVASTTRPMICGYDGKWVGSEVKCQRVVMMTVYRRRPWRGLLSPMMFRGR